MPIPLLTYLHPSSAHMGGLSLSGPWNHEGLTTIARTWKHQAARLLTKGEEEVDESATKGEQHGRNEVPRLIIGPRIYVSFAPVPSSYSTRPAKRCQSVHVRNPLEVK